MLCLLLVIKSSNTEGTFLPVIVLAAASPTAPNNLAVPTAQSDNPK